HGVKYNNAQVRQKFAKTDVQAGKAARQDFRGKEGQKVLDADRRPNARDRPGGGERPGAGERGSVADRDRGGADRAGGSRDRAGGTATCGSSTTSSGWSSRPTTGGSHRAQGFQRPSTEIADARGHDDHGSISTQLPPLSVVTTVRARGGNVGLFHARDRCCRPG